MKPISRATPIAQPWHLFKGTNHGRGFPARIAGGSFAWPYRRCVPVPANLGVLLARSARWCGAPHCSWLNSTCAGVFGAVSVRVHLELTNGSFMRRTDIEYDQNIMNLKTWNRDWNAMPVGSSCTVGETSNFFIPRQMSEGRKIDHHHYHQSVYIGAAHANKAIQHPESIDPTDVPLAGSMCLLWAFSGAAIWGSSAWLRYW